MVFLLDELFLEVVELELEVEHLLFGVGLEERCLVFFGGLEGFEEGLVFGGWEEGEVLGVEGGDLDNFLDYVEEGEVLVDEFLGNLVVILKNFSYF